MNHSPNSDHDQETIPLTSREESNHSRSNISSRSNLNSSSRSNLNSSLRSNSAIRSVYTDNPVSNCCELFDIQIEPDDTLQAISLKYRTSVFQLKLINNLMSDQEFYGLKSIKVPMPRFGINRERMNGQIRENNDDDDRDRNEGPLIDFSQPQSGHQRSRSAESINTSRPPGRKLASVTSVPSMEEIDRKEEEKQDVLEDHKLFISLVDKKVGDILERTEGMINSGDERIDLFISPDRNRLLRPGTLNSSTAYESRIDGADCGLTLWHLMVLIILICVLLPVIYIVLVEDPELLNNGTTDVGHHRPPPVTSLDNGHGLSNG